VEFTQNSWCIRELPHDFIQRYFHVEWPDRVIYHTMINTSMGDVAVVHIILDLMKTLNA